MMKLVTSVLLMAAAVAAACAQTSEASDSSASDLTGTIGESRACAAAEAYERASLADFDTTSSVPAAILNANLTIAGHFRIPNVGDGWVVDLDSRTVGIYDNTAKMIVVGHPSDNTWFYDNTAQALSCGGFAIPHIDGGRDLDASYGRD